MGALRSAAIVAANARPALRRGPRTLWRVVGESGGDSTDPGKVRKFVAPSGKTCRNVHFRACSLASGRRSQPVAVATHRLQQRFATGVSILRRSRDIDVNDIGERVLAIAPYLVEDAGAREDPAGRAHQEFEDGEFLGRELDGVAAAPDLQQVATRTVGNLNDVGARARNWHRRTRASMRASNSSKSKGLVR